MKKESIFTKEGFFGCDVFTLRFWKLRRSTLLRKVYFTAVEIRRHFPRRSLIFQRQEKAGGLFSSTFKKEVDFSQRLGETGRFFVIFKADRHSQRQRKGFFFQMSRKLKLYVVVSDQAFSILPMIFLSCPS
jgi:hypothetical protein